MPGDEAALVQAARRGDREAFGMLVSRYARSIVSVTTRMLGPGADTEDVAQETFVAAFKALPGFRLDSKFSTWLYRIAINKCTDWLRARHPEVQSLDDDGRDDDSRATIEPATEETPDWELERVELAWELDQAIEALPRLYREAFVLRHIEDLGYDEMSAILGVHRDTLKMRVYKARTLLCRSLAHLSGVHR